MGSVNVRIHDKTYNIISEIACKNGESRQDILDRAIEDYRRKQFIMEANKAYDILKNNPEKWQSEKKEREEWDVTLNDGLEDE